MDSGNEVIIVDDSIVTVNGMNGNHHDATEMKTRSKNGDDEPVKSKLRARAGSAATAVQKNSDEKVASDGEKKDKKKNLRSGDADSDSKLSGKEQPTVRLIQQEAKSGATGVSGPAKKGKPGDEEKSAPPTPAKKKVSEREDDSGINSRASSVSNDDTVAPRMRTRSSRTSELPSTSTPAFKKGQGRMPLSTYEFDESAFDDELSSNSLKRKAVLYIEEMDEAEEAAEEDGEPSPKRPSPMERTGKLVGTLLYPFLLIRGKFTFGRRTELMETPETDEAPASADEVKAASDNAENEKIEHTETTEPLTDTDQAINETDASRTCRVM